MIEINKEIKQKKYDSIPRINHPDLENAFHANDCVFVMEKLDGANASFMVDKKGNLKAFSRNTELDETEGLRGFYDWVHANINPLHLTKSYVYFGEWLVKHKLRYGQNENQFYLFDVYNVEKDRYESLESIIHENRYLNIPLAPIFYIGPYKNEDFINQFVGKSILGEQGEGIVVKKYYGQQIFAKVVAEKFIEVKPQKDPIPSTEMEATYIKNNLTKARVEKELYKLVDEGIVPEKFYLEEMSLILRHIGKRVHDDILKEEQPPDGIDFKTTQKFCGKLIPNIVKEIILESRK